jgi:hypothetical protein
MTENAVAVASGAAEVARANPSGIVLKDDHTQVAWFYCVCALILVVMGIVIPLTVDDGPWLAVMAIMGSVIIVALLSAAAVPHLLSSRRH